jgi:GTPase SAR1 family protein
MCDLNATSNFLQLTIPFHIIFVSQDLEVWREYDVDGYIIVYSITDRRSYQKAVDVMNSMRGDESHLAHEAATGSGSSSRSSKPVILVANKSDLERSRMIGKEGMTDIKLWLPCRTIN